MVTTFFTPSGSLFAFFFSCLRSAKEMKKVASYKNKNEIKKPIFQCNFATLMAADLRSWSQKHRYNINNHSVDHRDTKAEAVLIMV